MNDETSGVGWTKAEYDQCPELAGRLHSRILDLQDELERLRAQIERGCPDCGSTNHYVA